MKSTLGVIALYRLQAKGKAKGSEEERGRRGATGGLWNETPVRAGLRVACALSDPVRPVRSEVDALAAAYPVYLRWVYSIVGLFRFVSVIFRLYFGYI